MSTRNQLFFASLFLSSFAVAGCVEPEPGDGDDVAGETTDADADADADADVDADANADSSLPLDSDQDGLTDEEEAMYGTDPLKKDTDQDNYWDSWEIIEGTDPLDKESRIYQGYWPYNPDKDALDQGTWGGSKKNVGTPFPREAFLDHHGDMVDLYDFTNFTYNTTGDPAFFIIDLSAQWCGPCHNVASWIAGVDNGNTTWIQELYPTVREKVHDLRIWWITFLVQDSSGGLPTQADVTSWFQAHHDIYIPLLVDADNKVLDAYGANSFPHFFLLDYEMKLEYFPQPGESTNDDPYPAVGKVDKYL